MEEREASERKMEGLNRKLQELFSSFSVTLGGDYGLGNTTAFDKVISRVSMCLSSIETSDLTRRNQSVG